MHSLEDRFISVFLVNTTKNSEIFLEVVKSFNDESDKNVIARSLN